MPRYKSTEGKIVCQTTKTLKISQVYLCAIPLTNKQINKQTDKRQSKHNLLDG